MAQSRYLASHWFRFTLRSLLLVMLGLSVAIVAGTSASVPRRIEYTGRH